MKENTNKLEKMAEEINIFFKKNIKTIVIYSIIVFIINIVEFITIFAFLFEEYRKDYIVNFFKLADYQGVLHQQNIIMN